MVKTTTFPRLKHVLLMVKNDLTRQAYEDEKWNKTRCFVRQRKVIYEKGEEDILG
jgi:hypothetical protein